MLYVRGMIKKFSAWPSSVQNNVKIVCTSYSSKAQNAICTIWLLGYKYFVHFSARTKCLSDGVENANTRTEHKFLKNFSNDTDVTQQNFFSQLVIQDETCIHNFDSMSKQQSMKWNEQIGQNCHVITLCNSVFFHVKCKQPMNARTSTLKTTELSCGSRLGRDSPLISLCVLVFCMFWLIVVDLNGQLVTA